MYRYAVAIPALSLCVLMQTQAKFNDNATAEKKAGVPTIVLTRLVFGEKTLDLGYKIKNVSDHSVWVCDWQNVYGGVQSEVYLDLSTSDPSLVIHRHLDVLPAYSYCIRPYSHYVRLQAGEERSESLSFPLPLNVARVESIGRQVECPEHTTRLSIEIGYYDDDLPGMVRRLLKEAERISNTQIDFNLETLNEYYFRGPLISHFFGGLLGFNQCNEINSRSRDDEVLIPYANGLLKGERVLRISIDGLFIPCEEKKEWPPQGRLPDLAWWSRVDIQYEPSMLEYFFPYPGQQSLLSREERQYVSSLKTAVLTDRELLTDLAYEIRNASPSNVVAGPVMAHVTCYRDSERLTFFTVYNNTHIETEEKRWFRYRPGLQSFKTPAPEVRPFQMRVQCGSNLRDLWHRLRLFYKAANQAKTLYPAAAEWCDDMVRAYESIGMLKENVMRAHKCPGGGDGKNHYAMNPNCKPDSPADMVLLFETKAGWNQHGGPELFTFDNHDPKGGCVLLNGGTVKFIRTTEELQQLRWK